METAEKALSAGTGDNTALVASASRSEKQQAGLSGSSAGASSTAPASPAVAGEATPEPGSQPWPSVSAALAAAAAGGGSSSRGGTNNDKCYRSRRGYFDRYRYRLRWRRGWQPSRRSRSQVIVTLATAHGRSYEATRA